MSENKIVKTACQLCPECCGIDVHMQGEEIVKITGMQEHAWNKGRLCPKGAALKQWVTSSHRVLYPQKRDNGGWKRISWDEALDTIAEKLIQIKGQYGARALSALMGMAVLEQGITTHGMLSRFCDIYGTPNRFDVDSMCFRPRLIGYLHTIGKYTAPDIENAKCILTWAANPHISMPGISRRIEQAVKNGAKVLAIDIRRTYWAERAEIHAQVRPGTNCALALGMLNVIISEALYDKEFVEEWTVGFDKLAEHVKAYPPEKVEQISGVPAQTIRDLARTYATTKPACIVRGGCSLDMEPTAVHVSRAIAILQAITGNIDVPGGFVTPTSFKQNSPGLPERLTEKPLSYHRYPLIDQVFGMTMFGDYQGMLTWDAILKDDPYPVRAMIIDGCNPAVTFPNTKKVTEALEALDFLVVMDYVISETGQYADIILPASTFMERFDICDLYRMAGCTPYVILRKQAIQLGECKSDLTFWLELGKRMYPEEFPWKDDKEVLDWVLAPSGLTVKDLEEKYPAGVLHGSIKYGEYKTKGFKTPSRKVELYSETLEAFGYDPLPVHIEPPQSPISSPELAKKYPLILATGTRMKEFVHTKLREIPHLIKMMPEPLADMHPETAVQYGLADGEMVFVETKTGQIRIKLRVTDELMPGVVSIPHGWKDANVNLLTDHTPADPITGSPSMKALLCSVKKAA
jgi:formate dehydrogenase (coenzyme F420) alpha subunit